MEKTFDLVQTLEKHPLGYKSFNLTSTVTTASSVQGSAISGGYVMQPILFLRKAVDAARGRMRFLQVVGQQVLPDGHKDLIWPKRTKYLADSSWETSSAEYAAGSEIGWTQINTDEGVQFTPTNYNYGIALSNDAIRTNALNMIAYCNEELSYKYEYTIDTALVDAICGTITTAAASTATEPTTMSNTVNGAQTIFGGDATDATNSLDAGDVLTPEMLLKAKRLLMSSAGYYWSSNTHTVSAVTKNPWSEEEGFVAFIAPEQWESLISDSTFLSAAEYGGREAVLQGEIRNFAGIRLVVTEKVPQFISGKEIKVQGAYPDTDVTGHICAMVKPQKCAGMVWGRKAEFKVFDWPVADQIRMKLSMAYQAKVIHPDAIVRMVVSDA